MHERSAQSGGAGRFLLLLLLVCLVVRYVLWIGLAAATIVVLAALWKLTGVLDRWLEKREKRRECKRLELAELALRADQQNAQVLAGDDRGIYGDYTHASGV